VTSYRSLADMFAKRVASTPNNLAYQYPNQNGGWSSMTWRAAGERVKPIAMGLRALGLKNEERCAILSSTRIEWILADLGIACAGGATTTVYPSNTAEECAYILQDSNTRFVFAEDDSQCAKLAGVEKVITFDGQRRDGVITLEDLIEMGRAHLSDFEKVVASVEPKHLATLIYTSGTTGKPKGVELLHDCWVFEGEALERTNMMSRDDHQYLWLPLSHSFGKVLEAAQLAVGFGTTVDGRIDKLVDNLAVIRPTVMAAAPRIFEKVYNKVITGVQEKGGLSLAIFRWAMKVGRKVSSLRQQGTQPSGSLALAHRIADRLVFSKLRARFGGRVRFFISGSAPLSREIAEFFHAAGILILEGYGLTESSAATFVNRPDSYKFGSVGLPFEGVEVKLAPEDHEILIRGRGIMRGYHNLPEVTRETIDEEGWLHTGDIGAIDEQGHLSITDRKKDLIKTSGGKYIAPQKLEGKLKALCPYVSQVVVHGDRRNFCSALITLDPESLAKLNGRANVQEIVQRAIDQLNTELASYETIKKFAILEKDFSVETGELTASMKVRRKEVERRYRDVLDGFYAGAMESL
jgi:long-chain acyl-CoA synthetase